MENSEFENLVAGIGNTPLEHVNLWGKEVWVKREDKNPGKSFKDRSVANWVYELAKGGQEDFVVSSSGNSAVSSLLVCKALDVRLKIYVGNSIPGYKLERIEKNMYEKATLEQVDKPKSGAIKFGVENNYYNLRGSRDDLALKGFESLGIEIAMDVVPKEIFVCASSGTSTLGMYAGLAKELGEENLPALHVVQTEKVNTIVKNYDQEWQKSSESLANAISDKVGARKQMVRDLIDSTNGYGWTISDEYLKMVKQEVEQIGIKLEGYNAYLGFAGLKKALEAKKEVINPLVVVSGI